ncbi:hypothetical protein LQF76_11000 [Gloeomargaritales cyanobacterium VI4D9]|nr:hypothetical protein LQF76_11000 [Gloeomargaritales cyanobacterium VI4D9]
MENATVRVCANELKQIAESLAGIRGLLENPDDPLLPNHISVIIPALHSLESQLISISQLLSKQE